MWTVVAAALQFGQLAVENDGTDQAIIQRNSGCSNGWWTEYGKVGGLGIICPETIINSNLYTYRGANPMPDMQKLCRLLGVGEDRMAASLCSPQIKVRAANVSTAQNAEQAGPPPPPSHTHLYPSPSHPLTFIPTPTRTHLYVYVCVSMHSPTSI